MENWRPMPAAGRVHRGEEISMSRMIRSAALALVLATLMSAAAPALSCAGRSTPPRTSGFGAVWSWLGSLLVPGSPTAKPRIQAKAGAKMDPDGLQVVTIYPGSTTDAGSQMDPNGLN